MYPKPSIPLPPNTFPESAFRSAYQRCLALEAAASGLKAPTHCPPPIVCARLLGHLLRLAPDGNGRGQVQREIMSAADDTKLMEVAGVYLHGFIRAFKWSSGPTPAPSEHPSSPSFEDARAYSMELMQEGKLDHRKARDAALHRDNYRCVITGKLNIPQGGSTYVEAAHIIPEATNTKLKITIQRFHSASVWAVLSMFTDLDIIVDLAGNKIHRLENIITMNQHCHHLFDDLYLWLKPTEGPPHTYRVHLAREEWRKDEGIPEFITLTTTTDLPLPNGAYFALHALCCEVAWMSGAGEYIVDIERRMDDGRILANDGSNADLLASALAFVAVH